ncbi:MAG TPA: YihY/virulence factor BrkB family protein [Rickettsiales bacterium]|nr:YihY/virulence factor BrkB family protein [Rickettsiales bacterium]
MQKYQGTPILSAKTLLGLLGKAAVNTVRHDGIEHAGYLAFLGLLALFPFLVFIVALAGFFGEGQAGNEFIRLFFSYLPHDMVQALKPRIAEIISGPPQGLLTISIVGAIWTSSSELEGYRTVLNRAYDVTSPPAYIWRRLLSIAQTLILSFVLVVFMLVLVGVPLAWEKLPFLAKHIQMDTALGDQLTHASLLAIFLVVAAAYYFLPNIKQSLQSVVPGAFVVTFLWLLSARLLSLYISQFRQVNLIYGSLGGIIAALLFFYVSNIIFIYGAELNHLIKLALGERIERRR